MKNNFTFFWLISFVLAVFQSNAQNYSLGNDTVLQCGQSIILNPFVNAVYFEDSLIINYNAAMGQSQLVGASSVYIHSGYQEVAFGPVVAWVGNWGQDDGIGKMQNMGNNMWRFSMHVRNYFNIPAGINIHALAMVFRNEDGSLTGKDDNGNDIYLDIDITPPNSAFAGVNGTIKKDNIQSVLWSTGETTPTIQASYPGTYSVAVTDTNGTVYNDDIVISYNNNAIFNLGNDTIICGNMPYTLSTGITLSPFGDSITIIYDASKGVSQLIGANKVYFHSGYQLVSGGPVVSWVGNWGQDDGLGQMTAIGNNKWKITINIHSYYGINTPDSIYGLAMVFRNADGSLTGKDNTNSDIYMTVGVTPSSAFEGVSGTYFQSPYISVLWSNGDTTATSTITSSGVYSVEVTALGGCIMRDTVNISMGNIPFVDAGSSQQICQGDSIVLDAGQGFLTYTWSTGDTTPSITVQQTGTYIINVTNSLGCIGTDIINIEVLPAPQALFTYTLGNNGLVNFNSTSVDALTYAWDFNDDGVVDATSANPFYTYLNQGVYDVTLIVTNICGSDTITIPVNMFSGIKENTKNSLVVGPNPAHDFIEVQIINTAMDELEYKLQNLTGNTVKVGKLKSRNNRIDISELPVGIYFLQTYNYPNNQTFKVIIQ